MKKLRLSNIFHWLYAILMFLPFILLVCNIVLMFGNFNPLDDSGTFVYSTDFVNSLLFNSTPSFLFEYGEMEDVHIAITNVITFFTGADVDGTMIENGVWNLFVYWIEVSFLYLMFDLAMFPINLAHRWIDKGGLE